LSSKKPIGSNQIQADARKWRVLVLGNSLTTIVPLRRSRLDGPYAEILELLLRNEGLDVEVRNAGREYELLPEGIHRYQEEERAWSPDVVVVNYGIVDCQAPVIPKGIHNHFMTWETGLSRPAVAYRRVVAARVWPKLRDYQRFAMRRAAMRGWRVNPRRYGLELARLIMLARHDYRFVCVIDINPPGARLLHNLPGIEARRDVLQAITEKVVADAQVNDPDGVRRIPSAALADEMGIDEAIPDGYHWSPAAQRRVAEMLAAEIVPWIASHTIKPAAQKR